jgi:hypothetical protein
MPSPSNWNLSVPEFQLLTGTWCTYPIGPEPEAPDNGQAIDAGQAAASIHRMHHSNERPVGGAKIGHAEEPVSAAGRHPALSSYYLLPPHACSRHKLLAPGPPTSLPTTPGKKTRKIGPEQPEDAMWFPLIFAQKQTGLLRNPPNGH